MIDTTVLSIALDRLEFYKIKASLTKGVLEGETTKLLKGYSKYFDSYPDVDKLEESVFIPWYVRKFCQGVPEEDVRLQIKQLQSAFKVVVSDLARDTIITDIIELSVARELQEAVEQFNSGDMEEGIIARVTALLDKAKGTHTSSSWSAVSNDVHSILQQDINDEGISWRLESVNRSMRKLRGGDFGIFAARPDKGKTTSLVSEVTHWATQLPDTAGRVLWLNNEGLGERIVPRIYQATLGYKHSELLKACEDGTITDEYVNAIGNLDKIQVVDIHGWNYGQVAVLIEKVRPDVVIFDILDHLKGFKDAGSEVARLEELYKWAREQCVKFRFVGIAVSQMSVEAENVAYPNQSCLKDNKTGKQGTADFILMLGSKEEQGQEHRRFIGIPKNKLHKEGSRKSPQVEVSFRPEIARILDLEEEK